LLLAGCGGSGSAGGPPAPPAPTGAAGVGAPAAQTNCAQRVADPAGLAQALALASPGDTVCVTADLADTRLEITRGGADGAPITVLGQGRTAVAGISVKADNVVVDGFTADRPEAPGVELLGNHLTLRNVAVTEPQGDDGDGVRFFGSDITIAHNTISGTSNADGAHADCMQTFATDEKHPASQHVMIDANRCENIDNQCLIAEGPNSSAGDGSGEGESRDITFSNNYCEARADQAVYVDDVRDVVISGNQVAGRMVKAFAFANGSTDGVVKNNRLGQVRFEVGMDSSSKDGYRGPDAGGAP
jgi:hypothetical protein